MSQQQSELGQVRLLTTLEVLERVLKAGANSDDVETLAIELGVARWMKTKQEKQHEPIKSY